MTSDCDVDQFGNEYHGWFSTEVFSQFHRMSILAKDRRGLANLALINFQRRPIEEGDYRATARPRIPARPSWITAGDYIS
jgi:hypothetical protein